MDEMHLLACARYVEQNPVRAGIVERASDWPWSSACAHLSGENDHLVNVRPLLDRVDDWATFIDDRLSEEHLKVFRAGSRTGKPIGSEKFAERIAAETGRDLQVRPRGRPPKEKINGNK